MSLNIFRAEKSWPRINTFYFDVFMARLFCVSSYTNIQSAGLTFEFANGGGQTTRLIIIKTGETKEKNAGSSCRI